MNDDTNPSSLTAFRRPSPHFSSRPHLPMDSPEPGAGGHPGDWDPVGRDGDRLTWRAEEQWNDERLKTRRCWPMGCRADRHRSLSGLEGYARSPHARSASPATTAPTGVRSTRALQPPDAPSIRQSVRGDVVATDAAATNRRRRPDRFVSRFLRTGSRERSIQKPSHILVVGRLGTLRR